MRFRWVGLLIAVAAVVALIIKFRPVAPLPPPTTQVAVTRPASKPTTVAVDPTPRRLFDVLKLDHPAVVGATTQPLDRPLDTADAARYVLDYPVYLDDGADLWITHPQGDPVENEIRRMESRGYSGDGTHVVREVVRYIFWMNDAGKITPAVFVEVPDAPATQPATRPAGTHLEVVTAKGRLRMWHERTAYHFERALPTRDFLAVPTPDGVGVFTITPTSISEQYVDLRNGGPGSTAPPINDERLFPQVVLAAKGLLAWQPAAAGREGSGAWRFIDGKWSRLDETDWPTSIVQLSPFLDGTVQQLRQADGGKMELATVLLDAAAIDEKTVVDLLEQMGHLSEKVRDKAFRDLQRIGPAAWPICRKHYDDQITEVQNRLDTLLKAQAKPAIGSMSPVDGKLQVVDRFNNAGILVYANAGVNIPVPGQDEPAVVHPAWICIRPDAGPELLSEVLVKDLRPGAVDLIPVANEWIVADPVTGPRRFIGNGFLPVLRKSEWVFSRPVGSDRRGRWLYRQPGKTSPTLIIDPTLPDPTPRLPVWTIRVKNGSAGWTADGWPAIKRGGAWQLQGANWRSVDEEKNAYQTQLPDDWATTQPSDPALGRVLLTDRDGVRYFDGKETLTALPPVATTQTAGPQPSTQPAATVWALPNHALGKDPVTLLQSPDGKLWLFNQPGRVLRLARTGDAANPFKVEATFSKNIASIDRPTRIWIDPGGRICLVYDTTVLVMFTDGRIPRDVATKMSLEELQANEPD